MDIEDATSSPPHTEDEQNEDDYLSQKHCVERPIVESKEIRNMRLDLRFYKEMHEEDTEAIMNLKNDLAYNKREKAKFKSKLNKAKELIKKEPHLLSGLQNISHLLKLVRQFGELDLVQDGVMPDEVICEQILPLVREFGMDVDCRLRQGRPVLLTLALEGAKGRLSKDEMYQTLQREWGKDLCAAWYWGLYVVIVKLALPGRYVWSSTETKGKRGKGKRQIQKSNKYRNSTYETAMDKLFEEEKKN